MNFLNDNNLNAHWHTDVGAIPAQPVVAGDALWVPTRDAGGPGQSATLHAFNLADGTPHWQKPFAHVFISGVAVAGQMLLVSLTSTDLLSGEGALLALDPMTGEERWRWISGVQRVSAPAVGDAGIVFTVDTKQLIVLDLATGDERATMALDAKASLAAPALVADVVYVPCREDVLLAVGLDGERRWRFALEDDAHAWLDKTPVVVGDRLFAVLSTGAMVALQVPDGARIWCVDIGPSGEALSPPVSAGARLYVGAHDGLHALSLDDGRELWHTPTERCIAAAPVVQHGVVYATSHDHHLYALDAASGKGLGRYEVARRIEVAPVLAACGADAPCVIIADRGGTLTAVAQPLSVAEHEAAGHWREAARLYDALGEQVRAAALYEKAEAWPDAARLWSALERPLKQAAALERQALAQQDDARACAVLWDQVAELYAGMWQPDKAVQAHRAAARCRGEPFITVDVECEGLTVNTETTLRFTVRNKGGGTARTLVIRAAGEGFAGGVHKTQRLSTLAAGRTSARWVHVCPQRAGDHVQLQVILEYVGLSGAMQRRQRTLSFAVAATPTQRQAVTQRQILSPLPFDDLEVRIFARQAAGYPVEFTLNGEQVFPPRGHCAYLDADIASWQSSGDVGRDGARLFAALIADPELREAWGRVCGQAQRRRIRLRIDSAAPELHTLPWELMGEEGVSLAASAHTPFSRYLPIDKPWGQMVQARPIRVLALISNPSDLGTYNLASLDVEQERRALEQVCGEVGDEALQVEFLEPPVTLRRLEEALCQKYHVLHYVGHGTFQARRGRAALLMQDAMGHVQVVPDQDIQAMLTRQGTLPDLIVLAACESAKRSTVDVFRGLAPRLVTAGVPAVVAMQDRVSITTARQFSAAFYRHLLAHGIVDLAVNQARSLLLTDKRPDAGMPVLFMRLKDGKLWNM